jgi:gluconokinase
MLRGPGVVLVQLSADPARLEHRLRNRAGHFMRAGMLGSQLDTLEPPAPEENVLTVDTAPSVDAVVDAIITAYDLDTWQAG